MPSHETIEVSAHNDYSKRSGNRTAVLLWMCGGGAGIVQEPGRTAVRPGKDV